jgi:hypothetical protein
MHPATAEILHDAGFLHHEISGIGLSPRPLRPERFTDPRQSYIPDGLRLFTSSFESPVARAQRAALRISRVQPTHAQRPTAPRAVRMKVKGPNPYKLRIHRVVRQKSELELEMERLGFF